MAELTTVEEQRFLSGDQWTDDAVEEASTDQIHQKSLRKSVGGGGTGPFVVAFYGKGLYPAVEFYRLMIMTL